MDSVTQLPGRAEAVTLEGGDEIRQILAAGIRDRRDTLGGEDGLDCLSFEGCP